jgi:hypothetical protein
VLSSKESGLSARLLIAKEDLPVVLDYEAGSKMFPLSFLLKARPVGCLIVALWIKDDDPCSLGF